MTYQKLSILKQFNNEYHKKIYFDNIMRILGITDVNLINKILI